MKKSDELRIKTRKMIAKNLIILVALAVVAFVGAFSWMKDDPDVRATGISGKTKVNEGLEYFIVSPSSNDKYNDINTWIRNYNTNHASEAGFVARDWHKGELTFDFSDPELKFMENLFLCEVTGDGLTFNIPKLIQSGNVAYVDTDSAFTTAVANENYLSFDLYFRSKSQQRIRLVEDSSISPSGEISNTDDNSKKFAAIGAVRLSIVNGNTRELLWIPAPCVWYNSSMETVTTGISTFPNTYGSMIYNGSAVVASTESTDQHSYYSQSGSGNSSTRTRINLSRDLCTASTAGDYELGDDLEILTLGSMVDVDNDNIPDDGYYYGHVRVNLWIEGEDAEARLKMVGGKFNMILNFDIVETNN